MVERDFSFRVHDIMNLYEFIEAHLGPEFS